MSEPPPKLRWLQDGLESIDQNVIAADLNNGETDFMTTNLLLAVEIISNPKNEYSFYKDFRFFADSYLQWADIIPKIIFMDRPGWKKYNHKKKNIFYEKLDQLFENTFEMDPFITGFSSGELQFKAGANPYFFSYEASAGELRQDEQIPFSEKLAKNIPGRLYFAVPVNLIFKRNDTLEETIKFLFQQCSKFDAISCRMGLMMTRLFTEASHCADYDLPSYWSVLSRLHGVSFSSAHALKNELVPGLFDIGWISILPDNEFSEKQRNKLSQIDNVKLFRDLGYTAVVIGTKPRWLRIDQNDYREDYKQVASILEEKIYRNLERMLYPVLDDDEFDEWQNRFLK